MNSSLKLNWFLTGNNYRNRRIALLPFPASMAGASNRVGVNPSLTVCSLKSTVASKPPPLHLLHGSSCGLRHCPHYSYRLRPGSALPLVVAFLVVILLAIMVPSLHSSPSPFPLAPSVTGVPNLSPLSPPIPPSFLIVGRHTVSVLIHCSWGFVSITTPSLLRGSNACLFLP